MTDPEQLQIPTIDIPGTKCTICPRTSTEGAYSELDNTWICGDCMREIPVMGMCGEQWRTTQEVRAAGEYRDAL